MGVGFKLAEGYLAMARDPWVYLALLVFVLIQYYRTLRIERASFGVKVTSPWRDWGVSVLAGAAAGVVLSLAFYFLRVQFDWAAVIGVWVLTLVFAIFDVRLACVAYSGSVMAGVAAMGALLAAAGVALPNWLAGVAQAGGRSFFLLIGLLHVAEGVLTVYLGGRGAAPLFVKSRRGQIVGAYLLQKFWPIPAVVATPAGLFMPFPSLIGFSALALGEVSQGVARDAGWWVVLYGAVVSGLAFLAPLNPWVAVSGAVVAIALHEVLYRVLRDRQVKAQPIFVRPPRGVRILATLPQTPAVKLKLAAVETIVRVNGLAVNSPYDLHFAIDHNPAYAKLEIVDRRGEIRFAGTPMYTEDPHHLGAILVPDDRAQEYAEVFDLAIGNQVWRWWRSRQTRNPAGATEAVNVPGIGRGTVEP